MFPDMKYPYKEIRVVRRPWYGPVYLAYHGAPEKNKKRMLRSLWTPPDLGPEKLFQRML
jgi:hypothetical protein